MKNYDDIINMTHYVSKKRTPMSIENRAAQFAPFSALSGYNDKIKEVSRTVLKKIELDEEKKSIINKKILLLNDNIINNIEVCISYFVKDSKKDGGNYINVIDTVRKIDMYNKLIILNNGTKILFDDIYSIESNLFDDTISY